LRGAKLIPTYEMSGKIAKAVPDKSRVIVLYCQSGARSKKAQTILKQMGYRNVYNIQGGLNNM
jgi:rhodanese-related sulfurtransferase